MKTDEFTKIVVSPAVPPTAGLGTPRKAVRKQPFKKRLLAVAALIVLVAGGACIYLWSLPRTEYLTARVDRGDIDSTVTTTGNLNAVVTVQVGSQVSGNIKGLYADFNTKVKKGQLVALIDPAPFQAAVDQSKATLNSAKAAVLTAQASLAKSQSDLASALANVASQKANVVKAQSAADLAKVEADRRRILVQEQATSQEDYDTAKATYDQALASVDAAKAALNAAEASGESARKAVEVAQAQQQEAEATVQQDEAALAQAQLNLDHTRIIAPVDGTVESRNMDVGQTVAASFQAPTIFLIAQDLTKMQVDTNVGEADVASLRLDQQANFAVDAYPGQIFSGKIWQIRQAPINVQNVITYDVVIAVSNPDLKLFPGMTANVTIFTSHALECAQDSEGRVEISSPCRGGSEREKRACTGFQSVGGTASPANADDLRAGRSWAAETFAGEAGNQRFQLRAGSGWHFEGGPGAGCGHERASSRHARASPRWWHQAIRILEEVLCRLN